MRSIAIALAGTGASRRQFRLGQNSEINVTPFVDVMLVLLIIFMVVAPLATTTIRLDLPPAAPGHDHPVVVSIGSGGEVTVTGPLGARRTSLDALSGDLAAAIGGANPAARQVYIRAEPHARYGRFMAVMNRLQHDGYYKVGLVSEAVRG